MTFSATSPSSECNLTKLNVQKGTTQTLNQGGISLQVTAASGDNASWNTAESGSHAQTIALAQGAGITINTPSDEMKITQIIFHFEENNSKGYFAESSKTGGQLEASSANSYVNTQTWKLEAGATSVSFSSTAQKAYITSIEIAYQSGGLDNHTVQTYPHTWNFEDETLWTASESQFVTDIWTHNTENNANEWRNSTHEPTTATGYDVDMLRGLRFTSHVCADRRNKCLSIPQSATITIPSLEKGQRVKIHYTGMDILPTSNLKTIQSKTNDIQIYRATNDGDAILTVNNNDSKEPWGAWIQQISVLDVAPILTMAEPADKAMEVNPNKLTSIKVTSNKPLWIYDGSGLKTSEEKTINATLTSGDEDNDMIVTATFTAGENGTTELNFALPTDKKLESSTTYTLNIPENVVMETSGTGNENSNFTFSTKGLTYLGAYNGETLITDNPYTTSKLDNNRVIFSFEENLTKTDDFKVIVSDGSSIQTYTKVSTECDFVNGNSNQLYVPVTLKAGKYISINIAAGSLKDAAEGSTLKNNQIVLHLISSVEGVNLSMTTPYNHDEAPLSTRIILSAKDQNGEDANIKFNVAATLVGKSADGNETHEIGTVMGIVNGNKLVFSTKDGKILRPNYTYTLKLNKKAELNDVEGGELDDDTFVFTTASVTGNAPEVESTSPEAESTIAVSDVQPSTAKKIKVTFKEDIQVLDGALIFCRPMGGSESYTSIEYYNARTNNPIHVEGNKLWFEYSGQNLFYGMRYEVTIPTYAIVGAGGEPMDKEYKFYFETPKATNVTDSRDRKDVYTWDFTKISPATFSKIQESIDDGKSYWGKILDSKTKEFLGYGSGNANNGKKIYFTQGQEIEAGTTSQEILPEFKGLLINLVKNYSNRFQIACNDDANDRGDVYLYLNGGTHYLTLQSVPQNAKIFVEHGGASNEMLNLNSIGVDSLTTIKNANEHLVSMYKMKETKDVTFCVQNCKLYRIAIVKDFKSIGNADKDYIKYATYSQSYPVDYSLNETLNGTAVTGYSVSTDYQSDATYVKFTELPGNQASANEGVILKASGNLGESHPIFTTDVNTTPAKLTGNALVGTGDSSKKFEDAKVEGYQNYILTSRYFHIDKDEAQTGESIEGDKQCFYKWVKGDAKANFAYLKLKNPSDANAAKTVIYLDWFKDTTGVHGLTNASDTKTNMTYYTLDGRKVTSPVQKGIYIVDGKKVVIK